MSVAIYSHPAEPFVSTDTFTKYPLLSSGHLKDLPCQTKGKKIQLPLDNVPNVKTEGTCQLWDTATQVFPGCFAEGSWIINDPEKVRDTVRKGWRN